MAISLASIKRNTADKPPIVLVHGCPGVGKSTFAAAAPGVVFLPTEDGLGILDVDHFPLANSYDEVIGAMNALFAEEHTFKWLVIDSLSAFDPMVLDHMEAKYSKAEKAYGKYKALTYNLWRDFFEWVKALRNQRGMGVILLAHTDVTKFDQPDGDAYSRYSIALSDDIHELLREQCDVIGFAQLKIITIGGEEATKKGAKKAITTNERLLHLADKPAYIAKNRYWLPETIPLDWASFETALAESIKANKAPF